MRTKWLAGIIILLGITACAHVGGIEEKEKIYGINPPVIEKSFASDQLRPGGLWKIYIRASDPDGDMEGIVSVVEQTGMGSYPASYSRIKSENGKELSGYIYLNASGPAGYDFLHNQELKITVQIKDRAGHTSQPVSFKVLLSSRQTSKSPPEGVFKEVELGPIMVTLRPASGQRL
jgi:hypothetical protein